MSGKVTESSKIKKKLGPKRNNRNHLATGTNLKKKQKRKVAGIKTKNLNSMGDHLVSHSKPFKEAVLLKKKNPSLCSESKSPYECV